jgi:hypothetical protein
MSGSSPYGGAKLPQGQTVDPLWGASDGGEEDVNGPLFEQSLCPSSFLN